MGTASSVVAEPEVGGCCALIVLCCDCQFYPHHHNDNYLCDSLLNHSLGLQSVGGDHEHIIERCCCFKCGPSEWRSGAGARSAQLFFDDCLEQFYWRRSSRRLVQSGARVQFERRTVAGVSWHGRRRAPAHRLGDPLRSVRPPLLCRSQYAVHVLGEADPVAARLGDQARLEGPCLLRRPQYPDDDVAAAEQRAPDALPALAGTAGARCGAGQSTVPVSATEYSRNSRSQWE